MRCAGLERSPVHRINGKNTIPHVAASKKNANEETQYCLRSWCNITIKSYQRNMPRDSQSSGNKKQDKENFCGSEIEEDMNMHSHLFRSYNLSKRIGISGK